MPSWHWDIGLGVLGAIAAATGWAEGKCIEVLNLVKWGGALVVRSEEPAPVTVETADVAAAKTGHQHTVYRLAADDAGQLGRQGLPRLAVGASEGRRLLAIPFGWCDVYHGL